MSGIEKALLRHMAGQMMGPAAVAMAQAREAGVPDGVPFTREIDERGRVKITARRRSPAEREAKYRSLTRSMDRQERYDALKRRRLSRADRYDALARTMDPPASKHVPPHIARLKMKQ